jgi:hypothetical protein
LEVYDFRLANPDLMLWEIGDAIPRLQMANKLKSSDKASKRADKRNVLEATVSRYLKRAESSISNTSLGAFP